MAKKEQSKETRAKTRYEFGGPLGTAGITIGLPLLLYTFAYTCNDISGCPAPSLLSPSSFTLKKLAKETGWDKKGVSGLFSIEATLGVLAYYLLSLTLFTFLPGEEVEGTVLRSGARLKYKFNSFTSALVTLGAAVVGTAIYGADFPLWTFMWEQYVPILTANMLVAFFLATFVYVQSFSVRPRNAQHRELALGGHTGNLVYDWFIGRELNPPVTLPLFGTVDIKTFCELRPGIYGWILLDMAFAARQWKLHGGLSDSMVLAVGAQTLYAFDAMYLEAGMLTMIDITTDGFGFMLAFGDLAWLPFSYSLQARYLAVYPVHLGWGGIASTLAVLGVGYYVFRASNTEKDRFRTNPDDPAVKHLEYIKTPTGSKLICSGWWGRARHINYLGDWIMSWAYCLPTGMAGYLIRPHIAFPLGGKIAETVGAFPLGRPAAMEVYQGEARGWGMIVTYFYMVYFAVLLIHRERRDDAKCAKKYGKAWEQYKSKVRWRIVPYVY